jgi:CheY-like chemotaxis protein
MNYKSAQIMIVEDERIIALDIQNLLIQAGYPAPSVYSSGEAAIAAVKKNKPNLVLMDIMLKGKLDGLDAAKKIREYMDIPIIYITALIDEKTRKKAESVSPYELVGKPINIRQLLEVLETAMDSHPS